MTDNPRSGAVRAMDRNDEPRRKGAWLWLALLALAAAVVGGLLLARNAFDENDEEGLDTTNEASASGEVGDDPASDERDDSGEVDGSGEVGGSDGAGDPASTTEGAGAGVTPSSSVNTSSSAPATPSGGAGGPAASGAALTSEGESLLPPPSGGLAVYTAKTAEARGVTVQSVVSDEGFWVGEGETNRVFVRILTEGESPVQIVAGRTVSFTGTVTPNPADIARDFDVTDAEGGQLLAAQGQHIEITAVEQS